VDIHELSAEEWLYLSEETWNKISAKSPLKRAGLEKMKKNIRTLMSPHQNNEAD
jgi:hypothetical protein